MTVRTALYGTASWDLLTSFLMSSIATRTDIRLIMLLEDSNTLPKLTMIKDTVDYLKAMI